MSSAVLDVNDILYDSIELIMNKISLMEEYNQHIKSSFQYCDSNTGYNTITDIEYTDEYNHLHEQIDKLKKLINENENLIH